MKFKVIPALMCLSVMSCIAQINKNSLINWTSHPVPTNVDTLRTYSYSPNNWVVSEANDEIIVTKNKPEVDISSLPFKINPTEDEKSKIIGKLSLLNVDDGYLVGFYRGEWGGHLYWFSKDGKQHYKISDDNIIQFTKRTGKNYAIQGLAHLSMSEGSIITIEKVGDKWISKEYLKLPKAPDAIGLDAENNFIIMTSKSLLKVDADEKINTLIERGFWYDDLSANSIVVKNNVVYVGMRVGIFKYNLNSGNQEWLLPY